MLRILFFVLLATGLSAQSPVPAPKQQGAILILGATAHLGNGSVIANSAIAFDEGKLTLVADATTIRIDRSRYARIYDASGKHVYPGLIAPDATVGLVEIGAVRATQDTRDAGPINPQNRALIAYNTDSDIPPTLRTNGVLMAQITPEGGLMPGISSVVQMDAWNWEDAAVRADEGLHVNWPYWQSQSNDPSRTKNENYDRDVRTLRQFFDEAKAYCQKTAPEPVNLKYEAMRGIFDKKQTLYIHTGQSRAMQEAVLFAEIYGLKPVLVGANDAWLIVDFLRSHQVSLILSPTQRLPAREDEDVDQPFKTAAALQEAGILFAFSADGFWRQRNLPFMAGQAAGYGLPREAALSALTLNTAKILGIDSFTGSLETGKDATLFICEGDVLDMRSCIVTAAFIQGRTIDLDNKQKALTRKFNEKYKRQ
ncbi:MAG: amidohydrolase family protein [Saprospiraceae bacterium]|nr:amidohydrolase family protein [Saprospiraceae bacterium]